MLRKPKGGKIKETTVQKTVWSGERSCQLILIKEGYYTLKPTSLTEDNLAKDNLDKL